eukprot:11462319-Karenia_brevis.AAC.1
MFSDEFAGGADAVSFAPQRFISCSPPLQTVLHAFAEVLAYLLSLLETGDGNQKRFAERMLKDLQDA